MVTQSRFFKGPSTEPEVRRALELCKDRKPGDIVLHGELEKAFGEGYGTHRYASCVQALKRRLYRDYNWVLDGRGEAMGKGLKILLAEEKLRYGVGQARSGFRKVRRGGDVLSTIDDDDLAEPSRRLRDFAIFQLAKLAQLGRDGMRMIGSASKKPELLPRLKPEDWPEKKKH